MADGVIEIIIGSGDGGGNNAGGGSIARKPRAKNPHEAFANKLDSLLHPASSAQSELMKNIKEKWKPEHVAKATAAIYLVKDVASTLLRYANMEHNRAFSLKENYIAQNKVNAFNEEMGALKGVVTNVGSSIVMGAMAGGIPGAIVGGAYGVVKAAIDVNVQKEQKLEQYNMQLNSTNAQTQFSARRAALVNGSRGTEY